VAAAGINDAPHWEQKRALGAISAPQAGQHRASGLPQLRQKRAGAGFSVVQSGQRMATYLSGDSN
jgi:hypothetical protein